MSEFVCACLCLPGACFLIVVTIEFIAVNNMGACVCVFVCASFHVCVRACLPCVSVCAFAPVRVSFLWLPDRSYKT